MSHLALHARHAARVLRAVLFVLTLMVVSDAVSAATINVPADQPTLQAAVAVADSGDVILFAPGTHTGGVYINHKSLTIASWFHTTGDTAYIAQTELVGNTTDCSSDTLCRGDAMLEFGRFCHGSKVIGLTIRNGIKGVRSGSRIDLSYCRVMYTEDGTNYTTGGGGTIDHCLFAYNYDDGVDFNDKVSLVVRDNIIRDNDDDGVEFRMTPHSGSLLTVDFINNIITGNGEDGIQAIDSPDTSSRLIRIIGNYFANNAMASVGCMANGMTNQDFAGPQLPERMLIVGNTFRDGHYDISGGGNVVVLNNVFAGAQNVALWRVGTSSIASHNLFWQNALDSGESNVDTGHSWTLDPLLADDGRLTLGSPAIDLGAAFFEWQGQTILNLNPADYVGAAPDLGFAEYDVTLAGTTLAIEDVVLNESDAGPVSFDFVVRVSNPTAAEITVDYQSVDHNATVADSDYVAVTGTLTIPAFASTGSIHATVNGDPLAESDETFGVRLSNAVNATIVRTEGTGHIVNDDGATVTYDTRVLAGNDDAEEMSNTSVSLVSSDLEMMTDGSNVQRAVGVRFGGIPIPRGTRVTSAWIQFHAREAHSDPTSLVIRAEAADSARSFVAANGNLTARPTTTAQVAWTDVPAWIAGRAGPEQKTPELRAVIQEIVDRPGWNSGNPIAILVTGAGHRSASSFENTPSGAALLHVQYSAAPAANVAPVVSACSDTTVVVGAFANLRGTVTDDGRPEPAALSYQWNWLGDPDGALEPVELVARSGHRAAEIESPTSLATRVRFHTLGTYRLRLTVNDGQYPSHDVIDVTVVPDPGPVTNRPPVAVLDVAPAAGPAPLLVQSNAASSSDPDGDTLAYTFDFGDGTVVGPQASPTAVHTFAAGNWTVTLIVGDGHGAADTAQVVVNAHLNLVSNPSFEASLAGWSPNGGNPATLARVVGGHHGSMCAEVRADSSLTFGLNDSPNSVTVTADAGTVYRFGAWVRSGSHTGTIRIKVREYLGGVLQGQAVYSPMVPLNTEWQQVTLDYTTTVTGSALDMQILDTPVVVREVFQIDDISIHVVQAEPTGPAVKSPVASGAGLSATPEVGAAFGARLYPNPPGAHATINLTTTKPGFAKVRLYDTQGRLVRTLLDDAQLPAGRHAVRFETRGPGQALTEGMYFYSVQAAEGRVNGKFAILR